MTRTSNILCTALFLVALPGTLLHAQALAGPKLPAGVPDGYVITPFGYFHPSCVLKVAGGETLLAGGRILQRVDGTLESIPACQYPHYAASGKILAAGATKVESPTISGWVESASVTTSTSYGEIVATWIVPAAPASNNGQTVFFFPGMEDSNDVVSIIQPVLQYGPSEAGGGNNWAIASWNCCPSGTADYSTLVSVNSGDVIQGTVKSTCSAGTESCSTWNITTADETSGQSTALSNSPSEGQTFNWAFGGVLEAYNIAQCSDYPPNGALSFYNLALYDYNFNQISNPSWSLTDWVSGDTPQCSYGGQVTPTQVAIEYGTLPAPKLSDSNGWVACPTDVLFWTSVTGATSYQLWSEQPAGTPPFYEIYSGTSTALEITVPRGLTYLYEAAACDAQGCSGFSPQFQVTGERMCP